MYQPSHDSQVTTRGSDTKARGLSDYAATQLSS